MSTLVLLHGWPVTSHHWRRIIPAFPNVYAPDLPAFAKGSFEKVRIAREIEKRIPKGPYVVVGHDWGGTLAIALARISKRVQKIVIEEEIPPGIDVVIPPSPYPRWHGGFFRTPKLPEKLLAGNGFAEFIDFFLAGLPKRDRDIFQRAYKGKVEASLGYYRAQKLDAPFFQSIKLNIPALALGGKFGMGRAVYDSTKQMFPRCRYVEFAKSGHYPAQEEPEKFVRELRKFLNSR